jgi:chemotaxis protein CheD
MKRILVGIGEFKVGKSPDILVTMNLGSCVGIALYDGGIKAGGLAHIKLPKSPTSKLEANDAGIYADTAIQTMLAILAKMGIRQTFLTARIAGGGFMYKTEGLNAAQMESMDIGLRNVESVRDVLLKNRIKITGEEVLGKNPRTMEFYLETGEVVLKTRGMEDRRI